MQLLKIEWLKIKNYRTFWILIGIFVSLYLIWNYGLNRFFVQMNSNSINFTSESYAFPYVWNTMAYVYSWFIFFLCMFVIISMANEYTFKTQRQHIIDGMHRLDFLHAKSLLILAISLGATLFYTLLCLVFGAICGGSGVFEQIHMVLYVFIYTLNYLAFSALLTLFVKRSGLSIIIFLAYLMLESGIGAFINMKFNTQIGNLLPLQSSDELLPLRSLDKIKSLVSQGNTSSEIPILVFAALSVCFIVLYYVLAKRKILQSDL
ncbi:MAG: ABC transporter permease [Bacteroidetes bacterium]|jgi:ABC-2 type transport system permease protein|nr:ABC transporter permease [Bacteroidota bacterium]HMT36056.1 ABC transporter permease [Chitinophagaceae bacterium]MBK7039522.1 ABC transporter permease [Bacteroidota bacterium]MBK8330054.1 ABC transporter permease [Bacteroidota bacterium]MBK9301532.1 ABC transporter permease [Bacteroidota bacterium]